MNDLISRADALLILYDFAGCIVDTPGGHYRKAYEAYRRKLETLPSAQPKRGRWELDDEPHDGDCRCSRCGTVVEALHERHHGLLNTLTGGKWWTFYKYCPVCGAEMSEGGNDD